MEINIGERIFLKGDFVKKIVEDYSTSSRSFKIIAITDYAVGLKNIRSGRTYTITFASLLGNIDASAQTATTISKTISAPKIIDIPAPNNPVPVDPIPTIPAQNFEFVATKSIGGLTIKRIINPGTIIVEDDPFGGLYG